MAWQVGPKEIRWTWKTDDGHELGFKAEAIRRAPTGLHAQVSILQTGKTIEYDTLNVTRRSDRITLANAGWEGIHKDARPEKKVFAGLLHSFCGEFWERWNAEFGVEDVLPDPDAEAAPFALEPYIVEEGGTILYGAPGQGKSTLALLMCQSINQGVSRFWKVTKQPALFVNLERSGKSIKRRLTLVNYVLGLNLETTMPAINARGRNLSDLVHTIERAVEKRGTKVVFLDSITRTGFGNLNDNEPANRIMDALNSCCPTWLALGHTPKDREDSVFGSQMFTAAADIVIQTLTQRKEDGTLGVGLQVSKANDIAFPPMALWAMEFDKHGLSDFRPARRGEFAEVEGKRKQSMADTIADYLLSVGKDSATEIAKELTLDRANVSRVLNADERFIRVGSDGHRTLYAVKGQI